MGNSILGDAGSEKDRGEKMKERSKQVAITYDIIAEKYIRVNFEDIIFESFRDEFLLMIEKKGAKILDAGCGPGQDVSHFIEKGHKATGIDISPVMIKNAKKFVPKGEFKIMDLEDLEFSKESFDGLWALRSIIHIPKKDIPEVLKGFRKVLKKGGILMVGVIEGEGEKTISMPLTGKEEVFFNFFSQKEINSLVEEAGFKILDSVLLPSPKGEKYILVYGRK